VGRFFLFIFILLFLYGNAQNPYILSNKNGFVLRNKPYRYVGTNYWYGGFLAYDTIHNGKERLKKELDFLSIHGVNNLRVTLGAEGDSSYPYRISPSIQVSPRQYNESILRSYDYFLNEVKKRNMKIVFVLNNNWEWSGGFGQYLEWAGYKNPILPKTANWDWDKYCDYISQFYSCDSCLAWNQAWIEHILTRKNTINHINYKDDPSIMAWELANEPRPMRKNAVNSYKQWVVNSSKFIKSIDKNHLVTIGVEGVISTLMDSMIYTEIHSYPSIDYATIHIWPKTWRWYNGSHTHSTSDTSLQKTKDYIAFHHRLAKSIQKPLVIEEFGLNRDSNKFGKSSSTLHRDHYYQYVLNYGKKYQVQGYNFWGAFGYRDSHLKDDFWEYGLPYTADPPQEEQGLYGVYMSDSSTWKLIKRMSEIIKK